MMQNVRTVTLPQTGSEVPVPFVRFPSLGTGAPEAALSLLGAGDMSPFTGTGSANRARFAQALGIGASGALFLRQVHSRTVVAAEDQAPGEAREADGLMTVADGPVLSVSVADCMPIFLYDAGTGARALLHSGWKGTGIAAEAVRLMSERYGTRPGDVAALLGPSIGPCCYRVDEDRARLFASEWGDASVVRRDGRPHLDLRAANAALLERCGVGDLMIADVCTACTGSLGSYRRQGADRYTRMAALFGYFPG